MNRTRNRIILGAVCAGIAILAFFAEKFPFFIYEEEQIHTSLSEFFSLQHLVRLLPLLLIILLSAGIICLLIRLRRRFDPREGARAKRQQACAGINRPDKAHIIGQKRSGFMTIRWTCMILFSVIVMFGGILTGFTIAGIDLPVLACATNRDQLIESSCYFLAHIPRLLEEYSLSGVILFFVSTIGFALLLGRTICGFLCPMGLIQDTMHLIRQKTREKAFPMNEKRYRLLAPVRWLMILLLFGLTFAGAEFCSFCPALATSPILAGMKVSLYLSGFMMILVLVGSFFKRRFWCNICPLGYLIGLAHRVSPFRVKKDTVACTECGACYEACPMGVKMIYTEREHTDVTDINCIMCGECVRKCPEDGALALAFAGKKFYTASRTQVMSGFKG